MLQRFNLLMIATCGGLAVASCGSPMSESTALTTTLRIMETSDVHGQLLSYDYFAKAPKHGQGLAATAALIAQARTEQPLNILVENGDLIQGSALADYAVADFPVAQQTHPIIAMLNALEYDVANLGNHEFNFGLEYLAQTYRDANFPVLSSNVRSTAATPVALTERLTDIAWLERSVAHPQQPSQSIPLRIAVVGVLPPQIMQWDHHHLHDKIAVDDMLSAATAAVQRAQQQGADLIVLAAHTGMPQDTSKPEDDEQTGWLLAGIKGVDALLLGHQHKVFPGTDVYDLLPEVDTERGTVRGVPTVQPGVYGSHLGVIDLQLQYQDGAWQVREHKVATRAVIETTAAVPELEALVAPAHEATLAFMERPIGRTQQPLSYQTARWQASGAVQFVQRAQLWQAQQLLAAAGLEPLPVLSAAAPFDAAFSADDSATAVAAGTVTRGALGDLYRYPNTLDVVKVTGAQLKAWLEQSAKGFVQHEQGTDDCWAVVNPNFPHYNFDSILGLNYHIDIRLPEGERVQALTYQGQPVTDAQAFYVATNNYRANGGGDFPGLDGSQTVLRGADTLGDILLRYMDALPEKTYEEKLEKHWQVIGCGGRI